ncbi:MAG: DUF5691 domain-containing protein [Candidatus Competibacteraceae bacterium]
MQIWQDLLATALLGTAHQNLSVAMPNGELGEALRKIAWDDQEQALLSAAGLITLWRRAGQLPASGQATPPNVCASDEHPSCNDTSANHLQMMLQGHYSNVLPEWLTALAQAGQRPPAHCLPGLLEAGRIRAGLRDRILPILGQRGRWLAGQNPDWHYAIEQTDAAVWETGNREQRLAFLRNARQHAPARARELLQTGWSQDSAKERAAFLGVLITHLAMTDEPFLEQALDDRSKEVRRTAADLLARLPDSRLARRLSEIAAQLLPIQPGTCLKRDGIRIEPPSAGDPAWLRDGVDPKSACPYPGLGERAWLLAQILSAAPPSQWCRRWDTQPAEIVQAIRNNEWRQALLIGWTRATLRHRTSLGRKPYCLNYRTIGPSQSAEHPTAACREGYVFKLLERLPITRWTGLECFG